MGLNIQHFMLYKKSFRLRFSPVNVTSHIFYTADLVTFIEETLNKNNNYLLHILIATFFEHFLSCLRWTERIIYLQH